MNFWEQFVLSAVVGVLTGLKKTPQQVPALKSVLVTILEATCELLGVAPPTVP